MDNRKDTITLTGKSSEGILMHNDSGIMAIYDSWEPDNICLKTSLIQLHTHGLPSIVFAFHSDSFLISPDFHNPYLKL